MICRTLVWKERTTTTIKTKFASEQMECAINRLNEIWLNTYSCGFLSSNWILFAQNCSSWFMRCYRNTLWISLNWFDVSFWLCACRERFCQLFICFCQSVFLRFFLCCCCCCKFSIYLIVFEHVFFRCFCCGCVCVFIPNK